MKRLDQTNLNHLPASLQAMQKRRQALRFLGTSAAGLLLFGCGSGGGSDSSSSTSSSSTDSLASGSGTSGSSSSNTSGSSSSSSTSGNTDTVNPSTLGAHVVVIGGGMAGATVAKYLRLWGGTGLQVTLVEKNASYTSNIYSNLVLSGQRSLASLQYGYDTLVSAYGVRVVRASADGIDASRKRVRLSDGSDLSYDRLVIAPGVSFDLLPGQTAQDVETLTPHAWSAGTQTKVLTQQLRDMPAGGTFVMSIPAAPYRCPPGPYERACLVADWLKRNKPGSKVIVLDANPAITAERVNFTNAFDNIHRGVIEYVPNSVVKEIHPASRQIVTSLGTWKADVLNPIPPHRASAIATAAGVVNVNSRWAGVDVLSYESTAIPGIHVIGDASATTQPKAGHIANQEAKTCADAIIRLLQGQQPDQDPVTNSACYSPITMNTASWLTAVYGYDPVSKTMKVVTGATGEAEGPTAENWHDMDIWFNTLMTDSFA